MYDPSIGRWLEEDPMGFEAGDSNLYRYVGNKPTEETDPSGLFRLFGQQWVLPWANDAASVGDTLSAYGRAVGVAAAGTAAGAASGATTGALTGAVLGGVTTAGPGALPGAGIGAVGGGIGGGIGGFIGSIFADDAKDAAISGAIGGAITGPIGGASAVLRAARAAAAAATASRVAGLTEELTEAALTGLRNQGGHAIRHIEGIIIPNTGTLASRVEAFRRIAGPILQNPERVVSWRIGATNGTAYLGTVNGQRVVIVVATEGEYAGTVISGFLPDANQLAIILGR